MEPTDWNFGGRIHPKPEQPKSWGQLVDLENNRMAFIYKRLSSYEQVKKSIYSIKAQDALYELAMEDGYPEELIYVGERDLGISGTLGREDRPELAYLIELVEAGKVEAVYTVHISRLYRDQTLINALALGELFKKHDVIVVTPQMRLNLKDKMHMRLYRMEVERAADELELMAHRMLSARDIKAKSGLYAGEKLPPGYIVDEQETLDDGRPNPNYHSYLIHEPHAEVVRKIYRLIVKPGMSQVRVARYCNDNGITFPPFPRQLNTPANRKTYVRSKRLPDGSWPVTVTRVHGIISNPAYIGWKIWGGQVVSKDTYPPIVEEKLFWTIQKHHGRSGSPKKDHDPLPLAGLLYCGNHNQLRSMGYSHNARRGQPIYQCYDNDLHLYCSSFVSYILDDPLSEAIISQLTLPGLAERVLARLTDEYQLAKEQTASYRREMDRLKAEVENLRGNLSSGVMSAAQLKWLDEQIGVRLNRILELADLESRPIGAAIGQPVPGEEDINLVRDFLSNLDESWPDQPDALKNALLRLLLDKVIVWSNATEIKVRLVWRAGLEQELLIERPVKGCWEEWTDEEIAILKEHYATSAPEKMKSLLPRRTWRAIKTKAKRLKMNRANPARTQRSKRYTKEEDKQIRRFYAGELTWDDVLEATGRTRDSIESRARRLKLGHRVQRVHWSWLDSGGTSRDMADATTYDKDSSRPAQSGSDRRSAESHQTARSPALARCCVRSPATPP